MFYLYSKLINKPVLSLKEQLEIGRISDIVFDPDEKMIVAFGLRQKFSFLPAKTKIITMADVIQIVNDAIFVNDLDAMTELSDNPKISKLVQGSYFGVGQIVLNKKKVIGRLFDYVIEGQSGTITKIYIKSFLREKIISSNLIKKIKNRRITLKLDENEESELAVEKEAECLA